MIPTEFYTTGQCPVVTTVGELKAQLARLPDDLPVCVGFTIGLAMGVYIHRVGDVRLLFKEPNNFIDVEDDEDYID